MLKKIQEVLYNLFDIFIFKYNIYLQSIHYQFNTNTRVLGTHIGTRYQEVLKERRDNLWGIIGFRGCSTHNGCSWPSRAYTVGRVLCTKSLRVDLLPSVSITPLSPHINCGISVAIFTSDVLQIAGAFCVCQCE